MQTGGRTIKRNVPTMDGVSIEATLYCIREFQEISLALNFDTGPELFNNFCHTLQGVAKDDWDSVITLIPICTNVAFFQALDLWKNEMILLTASLPSSCRLFGNPD
jgi:hypothetical protein